MDYKDIVWRGFSGVEFEFMGQPVNVIKPQGNPNGKWVFKTEYFDAFPNVQNTLLDMGSYIAHIKNILK